MVLNVVLWVAAITHVRPAIAFQARIRLVASTRRSTASIETGIVRRKGRVALITEMFRASSTMEKSSSSHVKIQGKVGGLNFAETNNNVYGLVRHSHVLYWPGVAIMI